MSIASPAVNVMAAAARKAARSLARDLGEVQSLQASVRGADSFVAAARKRASGTLRQELERARPAYGWFDEDGAEDGRDPTRRWVATALDGVVNFSHGSARFAISVALEQKGEATSAVLLDVIQNTLYVAERGQGAYGDDRRLRVSARTELAGALAVFDAARGGEAAVALVRDLARVAPRVAGIRGYGAPSLDLAALAAGRIDAFWAREAALPSLAAGLLIARESGALCSRFDGQPPTRADGDIVAATPGLHEKLLGLLSEG